MKNQKRNSFCIYLFTVTLFFCYHYSFADNNKGRITIKVINLKNSLGFVRLSLFDSEDGFPDNKKKSYRNLSKKLIHKQAVITFTNIPYGTYAVGLLHDENANKEMDTNWLGIPQEGYGASNDASNTFGPPDFNDAKIVLQATNLIITIKVRY